MGLIGANGEQPDNYIVTLLMDRKTLAVKLDTEITDIDTVMNMLATAMRYLDVQYRIAMGIKAQEQYKQQQADMQVAAAMLKARQ